MPQLSIVSFMRFLFALLLFALCEVALAGGASPWCLIRDDAELCQYEDADDCYKAVPRNGGYCRENFKAAGVVGESNFCVITANSRRCTYYSQQSCINAAAKMKGGCVPNRDKNQQKSGSGGGWGSSKKKS